ncbi:MAG: Fic family protein [Candidatus Moranbacteria bacterium]|nr:Fic family protein [Candidatus Moranbacteria bacterium]
MFNSKKPYNRLPLLPPRVNFDDVKLLKLVNRANMALSELNGSSRLLPDQFLLISPLVIKEGVASNKIENINTTVKNVFKAEALYDLEKESGYAEKETLNYRKAIKYGARQIKKNKALTIEDILKIQSFIEPKKAGIRNTRVSIVNNLTEKTIYTPPQGYALILKKLKNFQIYFNNQDFRKVDPLIKLAVLHYQFEAIHPFRDGNGRTGRILAVLYLVMVKRLDLPILFLSGYILKHRSQYYNCLKAVTKSKKWLKMTEFFLKAVIFQARQSTKDILRIKRLMQKYKNLDTTKRNSFFSPQLLDYLFSSPFYTQKTMQKKLKIHRNTASKYFNYLEELKIVKKFKYKKYNVYYNQEFLEILSPKMNNY